MLPVIDLRGSGRDPAGLLPRAPADAVPERADPQGAERLLGDGHVDGGQQ